MANAVYPKFREAQLDASVNTDLNDGTVKAVLIDTTDYTYSAAHDFYDDVPAGARVGTPQTIALTTVLDGLFDGDNVTFTGLTGENAEAIIIFIDTGVEATSRLVAYFDTGVTGLPVTPNGGDVTIAWHASGIIQF